MIEKIKYMIELHNLTTSCRDRDLVYKRAYIYSELRKLNYKLSDIGRLLDKHHATIINGLKVDNQFQNCDKIYDDIGRRRGFLLKKNEVDYDKVSVTFLHEFRNGIFGPIILDRVSELD